MRDDLDGPLHLTGPEALDGDEVAARLGVQAHRPAARQWRETVVAAGLDPWLADSTVHLFEAVARGALAETTDTVERVLGRRPPRPRVVSSTARPRQAVREQRVRAAGVAAIRRGPKTRAVGYCGQPGSPVRANAAHDVAHRGRERAAVVVETDERVPAVDEVAERERDVDAVARADLRAFPREAVRVGRSVRRVRVEHRAARHLHLVVAEQRAPDLVRVVGAERALRSRRRRCRPRSRRRRGSAPRCRTSFSRWHRRGRRVDEQPHLVGGRARDERDAGRGAAPRSASTGVRGQDVVVDHRMERHHPDRAEQRRPSPADCAATSASVGRSRSVGRIARRRPPSISASSDERGACVVEGRERRAALHDRARDAGPGRPATRARAARRSAAAPTRRTRRRAPGRRRTRAMLSRTHSSAEIASRTPQFATPPNDRASRKPNAPSR